jgi:hypothetical protein
VFRNPNTVPVGVLLLFTSPVLFPLIVKLPKRSIQPLAVPQEIQLDFKYSFKEANRGTVLTNTGSAITH